MYCIAGTKRYVNAVMCRTPARSAATTISSASATDSAKRLLAQHVTAAVGGGHDEIAVEPVGGRDDHGVNRRVLQQRKRIGIRACHAGHRRGFGKRRRVGIAQRDDFGIAAKADARNVIGHGDLAGADEGDSDGHMCRRDVLQRPGQETESGVGDHSGEGASHRQEVPEPGSCDILSTPDLLCRLLRLCHGIVARASTVARRRE